MDMVITEISAREVVRLSRETLCLPVPVNSEIDDPQIAGSIRRAAGILCPCSLSTLVSAVLDSFRYLSGDDDDNAERLFAAAEALIICGDLLELNQVTIDDPAVKATWIFAAPPSFVQRPGGNIFLIGITPDSPTSLPSSINARVSYEGCTRVLTPEPSENLPAILRELGLHELPTSTWLKAPKSGSATELRDTMNQRLSAQPLSGAVADVSILDPARNVQYYPGRWVSPTNESGNFVSRRPQAYGAPLWGFAQLVNGVVNRFLDFPLKGYRWRGCDLAWQLQMAIDHCRGTPQHYRRRPDSTGAVLDFFSPIPLWAQRRLAVLGRPVSRERCLFSYWIPERELASEESFLQNQLWMVHFDEVR
jgi:hypothetical protein